MLILCGYSGCGKTTLAQAYAQRFGGLAVDTDAQLEARFGQRVRDLHLAWGESRFRHEEAAVLASLPPNISVLATGGGVLCHEENALLLQEMGTLVYLEVPPEVLWMRLCQREFPPTFVAGGHRAFFDHYMQRHTLYARWGERVLLDAGLEAKVEALHVLMEGNQLRSFPSREKKKEKGSSIYGE